MNDFLMYDVILVLVLTPFMSRATTRSWIEGQEIFGSIFTSLFFYAILKLVMLCVVTQSLLIGITEITFWQHALAASIGWSLTLALLCYAIYKRRLKEQKEANKR